MAEGPRNAYALLIGIGDYRHGDTVPGLRYAVRDAEALHLLLTDPDLCAFPPDNVALLTDAGADRDHIVHRLSNWLPARSRSADLVLIYFAGHGMVHRLGEQEQGFLLAHDADPEDIVTRGVSMADVNQWLNMIQAAAVVVCLDCCHAGKVLDPTATVRAATRDLELRPQVLKGMEGRGRYLIASCNAGQKSFECEDLEHGLFTYHLLKGIGGTADSAPDGRVGIGALFAYVARAVSQEAQRRFARPQTPWISATYGDEAYISRVTFDPTDDTRTVGERTQSPYRQLAKHLVAGNVEGALRDLRRLRTARDVRFVPLLFRCLSHADEQVREQARLALHALGWSKTAAAVQELARDGDPRLGDVLDGLAAFEAHRDVVELLNRLVDLLRGDARNRAILLLERKRLSLELEQMTKLFQDIHSPCRLKRVLGQGLITAVYLGQMEGSERIVVVRVLRPELARQPVVRARFLDLAYLSERRVHHNLVMTREVRAFTDHNIYFAICDYVDGVTLQKVIEGGKRFLPAQVVYIARQLLAALSPLHERGVSHGGVKPANVFLCGHDRVLLGDASLPPQGIVLPLDRLSYDYRYAAPEAIKRNSTPASDLYALGCVVYELLCGQPPFVDDDYHELAARHMRDTAAAPSAAAPGVHPTWDEFLSKLLARDEKLRYGGLGEAFLALVQVERALATPPPVEPAPQGAPDQTVHTLIDPPSKPGDPATLAPLLASASLDNYRSMVSLVPFNLGGTIGTAQTSAPPPPTPPPAPPPPPAEAVTVPPEAYPAEIRVTASRYPLIPGYEIESVLGKGGMGAVYKAKQVALERVVALKILEPLTPDTNAAARFRTEARAVAQLDHPNIVGIYDMGDHQGQLFLTLQLCEGGTLADRVRQGPMPQSDSAALVADVALGVHYAHERGILHRDLKPSNILLTGDGRPRVGDFGLARILRGARPEQITGAGVVLGTPGYMAPEQVTGERAQLSAMTDVYGLGAILYTLLTGQAPFGGESSMEALAQILHKEPTPVRDLAPQVDPELERICMRCLAKQASQRYASAAALAQDLRSWLKGVREAVVDEAPAGRFWGGAALRWAVLGLALLVVVALLLLVLGMTPAEQ